ncbi:MAG: sigma-70 family RNA polymerase sigma factor [Pirellulales bacterium]
MESDPNRPHLEELLRRSAAGDAAAREELLALYRPYLRLVAGRRLPKMIRKRVDASDLVQHTLLDAVRGLPDFRGQTEPEFTAWIMKLLERNLLQGIRNHTLGKRDIRLEQDWSASGGSALMMWHSLSGDGSSPMSNILHGEAALHLALALDKLPEDQRTAVEMRYIDQLPLQAIADEMGRSVGSVAGLIRRGVEAMQGFLPSEFGEIA